MLRSRLVSMVSHEIFIKFLIEGRSRDFLKEGADFQNCLKHVDGFFLRLTNLIF